MWRRDCVVNKWDSQYTVHKQRRGGVTVWFTNGTHNRRVRTPSSFVDFSLKMTIYPHCLVLGRTGKWTQERSIKLVVFVSHQNTLFYHKNTYYDLTFMLQHFQWKQHLKGCDSYFKGNNFFFLVICNVPTLIEYLVM